jgi:TIR domain
MACVSRPGCPSRSTKSRVFISFRNGDEPFGALLMHMVLSEHLGAHTVFRSTDSIAPGDDYVESLVAAVHQCELMLVVVGPRWMSVADERGRPRILDPNDWVYRELAMAFAERKRVIPVLLDGSRMPAQTDLPPGIGNLARCQYRRLEHRQFRASMSLLVSEVRALLSEADPATGPRACVPQSRPCS